MPWKLNLIGIVERREEGIFCVPRGVKSIHVDLCDVARRWKMLAESVTTAWLIMLIVTLHSLAPCSPDGRTLDNGPLDNGPVASVFDSWFAFDSYLSMILLLLFVTRPTEKTRTFISYYGAIRWHNRWKGKETWTLSHLPQCCFIVVFFQRRSVELDEEKSILFM